MSERRRVLGERRLRGAEAAYVETLRTALEACAAGRWGLFGQNAHYPEGARQRPTAVRELEALAGQINDLRAQLGFEPFSLHAHFLSLCGRDGENQPGEPKIAALLLRSLNDYLN